MPASLEMLETAVQAAVQAMIDCKTIPSESVKAIWSDSGHKELEPVLRSSLLKFEAVGSADAFFAAVPTSGEVVFGVGDRAKLGFHKSGGTGAMTKMTGTKLVAAGLTDCILGIFTNGAGSGANADSVMVGGLATTLAPVCSSEFTQIAITINEGQTQQQAVDVHSVAPPLREIPIALMSHPWRECPSPPRRSGESLPWAEGLQAVASN